MYSYEFHGEGVALGSTIVVVCYTQRVALRLARKFMADNGLEADTLVLQQTKSFESPAIVYSDSGDY